jgi:hypothetical protein
MVREGMKVRFVNALAHETLPQCFPPPGTVGTVTTVHGNTCCFVQWPDGSTSERDEWAAPLDCLVEVAE